MARTCRGIRETVKQVKDSRLHLLHNLLLYTLVGRFYELTLDTMVDLSNDLS